MLTSPIHIDFEILSKAFEKYVRDKAIEHGNTIVYKQGNYFVEENPKTKKKIFLKEYTLPDN